MESARVDEHVASINNQGSPAGALLLRLLLCKFSGFPGGLQLEF